MRCPLIMRTEGGLTGFAEWAQVNVSIHLFSWNTLIILNMLSSEKVSVYSFLTLSKQELAS